jgi:hypothetical protein
MARPNHSYRATRRKWAKFHRRAARRAGIPFGTVSQAMSPSSFNAQGGNPRSAGSAAVAEHPPVTAFERQLNDWHERMILLCMERDELPADHPRRRVLDAEAKDLAHKLAWTDQWASSEADLNSHVA